MSIRNIIFTNNEYYHIFNRGVDKRIIFIDRQDIYYFFNRLVDLNTTENSDSILRNKRINSGGNQTCQARLDTLIYIVAYCLLPNHFHLILKQKVDGGVSKFMQKLGTSYVTYFNQKYERGGSLFQGKFKAKHITGELRLPALSVYVNFNYRHHGIDLVKNLVISSIKEYLNGNTKGKICEQTEIDSVISEIGNINDYEKYANDMSKYFADNKGLKLGNIDFYQLFEQ